MTTLDDVLAKSRALLAAVDFDNNGDMVGMSRMGGNGGMLSLGTTKAADALRLAFDQLDTQLRDAAARVESVARAILKVQFYDGEEEHYADLEQFYRDIDPDHWFNAVAMATAALEAA